MEGAITALVSVVIGWILGLATVDWQLRRTRNEAAHARVGEALSGVNNLLWDYSLVGGPNPVDLSPSRVDKNELNQSSSRWRAIRPQLTAVSIGDPDPEIRRIAGELSRAMSLFTRVLDRSDRSTEQNLQRLADQGDQCWKLAHELERRNLTRIRGADPADLDESVQLDRLKGDRRFHQDDTK